MNLIKDAYENWLSTLSETQKLEEWYKQIQLAEQDCLENGITSFQDAGANFEEIERYKKLAEQGELDVRLWSMISASQDNLAAQAKAFPLIGIGNNFFTVRASKPTWMAH